MRDLVFKKTFLKARVQWIDNKLRKGGNRSVRGPAIFDKTVKCSHKGGMVVTGPKYDFYTVKLFTEKFGCHPSETNPPTKIQKIKIGNSETIRGVAVLQPGQEEGKFEMAHVDSRKASMDMLLDTTAERCRRGQSRDAFAASLKAAGSNNAIPVLTTENIRTRIAARGGGSEAKAAKACSDSDESLGLLSGNSSDSDADPFKGLLPAASHTATGRGRGRGGGSGRGSGRGRGGSSASGVSAASVSTGCGRSGTPASSSMPKTLASKRAGSAGATLTYTVELRELIREGEAQLRRFANSEDVELLKVGPTDD